MNTHTQFSAPELCPELLDLYDGYAHGALTRREFLSRAGEVSGDCGRIGDLSGLMRPDYARAQQVGFDDPAIKAEWMTYRSPMGHGEIRGYMVRPRGVSVAPGVVVVHEDRGLNPYIRDVARRLAKAGFVALAPDGLTPMGGYPGHDDDARAMQRKLDGDKLTNDFFAGIEHLLDHEGVTGKVGILGFSMGGGIANAAALEYPELAAAVSFYGAAPEIAEVAGIEAPMLLHYAGRDHRVTADWPALEAALTAHGKIHEGHVYDGASHGFHNATTLGHDEAMADLAWERSTDWLNQHLR